MWKLLRNLLLSAGVLALGVKLALWLAAGQQAQWLADSLKRWGVLSWSGATGSFDGDIKLSGVQFKPNAGSEFAGFSASTLELRTPGLLWLLARAITRDESIPTELGLRVRDVNLPSLRKLANANDPPWFGVQSLVPFETFACGASKELTPADFVSMQVQPRPPTVVLHYRYDAGTQNLEADIRIENPQFGTLGLRSELRHINAQFFDSAAAREAVRIASADFSYADADFLRRRNQFCARETGVDVDGFIDRHIAAVQERLKVSHIVPAEGVVDMYRTLLRGGGDVKLLSLPREDIAPAQYDTYDPEEVLRWLNLTARHNDAPPVLFKLFFLAEPVEALAGIDLALMHDPLAEPEPQPETVVVRPEENPVLATTTNAPKPGTPATAPPLATTTPEPPITTSAVTPLPTSPVKPETTKAPPTEPAAVPGDTTAATRPATRIDPRLDPRLAGLPSAPPPPPGSTAALVWQGPRIDRLPEKTAARERPFAVISYDALNGQTGSRVVLITSGGKEIEGKVAEVSAAGVTVSVNRESGQARLFVERARILEIRLARRG
ncbi:MAG TPA: hypothetical protein VLF18_09990 [Tahibacter sp.]|uniref:hypothetical protein n=1 Tax=Tahibacter sp. TaxID=2056211 RepID=UPI002C4A596B|nr:hypothetical protein [Tahibacter sp.]HSX60517.1 hypothetical protein [Tahibacter sp.]